jgi:hypothetical protein
MNRNGTQEGTQMHTLKHSAHVGNIGTNTQTHTYIHMCTQTHTHIYIHLGRLKPQVPAVLVSKM